MFALVWKSEKKLWESEVGFAHTLVVMLVEETLVISWTAAVLMVCDVPCSCPASAYSECSRRAPTPLELSLHALTCPTGFMLQNRLQAIKEILLLRANKTSHHFTRDVC